MSDGVPDKSRLEVSDALRDEILRFSKQLCVGIRSPRARLAAEEELVDHIYAALYDEALRGVPPETALPAVCASFGDPSVLRGQLATVHNRVPPELFRSLGFFALRLLVAVVVTQFLRGMCRQSGYPFGWYTELPGVLILCGLRPLGAARRAWSRGRFRGQLRRLCRRSGWELLCLPSRGRVLFAPATARYAVRTGERVTVIRHLSVCRGDALRFVDETCILRIRRRGGVGLADRNPYRYNSTRTAALGHVTLRPASFSFLLPPDLASAGKDAPAVEKLVVIDTFPREVSAVVGSAVREVIAGERVFDFAVHSRASCMAHLQVHSKGDHAP